MWETKRLDSYGTVWSVKVTALFNCVGGNENVSGEVNINLHVGEAEYAFPLFVEIGPNLTEVEYEFTLDVMEENLWWPNGLGEQKLHPLTVKFNQVEGSSTIERMVGFREVVVVEEPFGKGNTFYFKVNNVPLFAKGSNWIPPHVLPELVTDDSINQLLQSAKEANMNMLRIWGGGNYESDNFYRMADELGILIWQDFMFACSLYPADHSSLESIKKEVTQQIRRLQHHACLAVWAGNNENEAALVQNWWGTNGNYSIYIDDYLKLYVDTIKVLVENEDPSRPFLVSSPSNGIKKTEESGFININPASNYFGDIHYYNYESDGWNTMSYPHGAKFISEYGWQSFPSFEVLEPYSLPEDWGVFTKWATHRQRHGRNGNAELLNQITSHFDFNDVSGKDGFKRFLYLSQVR